MLSCCHPSALYCPTPTRACPTPTPPLPGLLHRATDFIRASEGQRWRDCHLWSPHLGTDIRHYSHLQLRCHSRGKPGSREGPGVGIRKLDKGSHSRRGRGQWACLDKGCLGERTQRTRICISTPRKMAGIRGTPYNFSVDQPKARSVRKGMARRSGLLGSLFSSVPQAGSAAQGVHLFFAASLTTHTSRRQAPPSKL